MVSPTTLPGWLARWAEDAPERRFLDGPVALSFSDVARAVDRRAAELRAELAHSERPVALAGHSDASWVINLLAALSARVPVMLTPPSWTNREERHAFATAGAGAVLRAGRLERLQTSGESAWPVGRAALAFATSGSTGRPRLALRSEASLEAEGRRWVRACGADGQDVVLGALPLAHAFGFGAALAFALVGGCTLWLETFTTPRGMAKSIIAGNATILPMVGPMARGLALVDSGRAIASALRFAVVGAGRCTRRMSDDFASKWGIGLAENYGSSETGALLLRPANSVYDGTGFPMEGVECCVDPAEGDAGQLWIKSLTPPVGHLTEGGFEPARLAPMRFWPTGDLATMAPLGLVSIVGRMDQQIRRGGHTIAPGEVAEALLRHPTVAEAVVRAADDPVDGQAVEAHIAFAPGQTATPKELQAALVDRLAPYKWPTRWVFHAALPKTWSGKATAPRTNSATRHPGSRMLVALMSQRLSAALGAAERVGLLRALRTPRAVASLSEQLALDRTALRIFLDLLLCAGIAKEEDGEWSLCEPSEVWRSDVVELELALRESWLRPDAIASVLRSGSASREFERSLDNERFFGAYRRGMCGPTQASLAMTALRSAGRPASILEVGRGIGALGEFAHSRGSLRYRAVPIGPKPAVVTPWLESSEHASDVREWGDLGLAGERFDLVYVVNAAHWIRPGTEPFALGQLLDAIEPSGRLVITDIFAPVVKRADDDEELLRATLLLDWLTHGGTHLLRADDLVVALRSAGAQHVTLSPGDLFQSLTVHGRALTENKGDNHERYEDQAENVARASSPTRTEPGVAP